MRRLLVVALLAPLLLAAGCRSEQDTYCDAVKSHQSALGDIVGSGTSTTALLRALPIFTDLRDAAPDDIRDDWRTVIDAITGLRDALDAAHVDAATYDRDHPPAGVTATQRAAIDDAAAGLTTQATVTALGAVQQEALDVCKTPLSL